LIFFTDLPGDEATIAGAMIAFMIVFGAAMWYLGKKSEVRSAAIQPDATGEAGHSGQT
jgi:hypothetical protein